MTTCRRLFHCASCRANHSRDEMWCFVVRQTDQPETVGFLTSRQKEARMFLYKIPPQKTANGFDLNVTLNSLATIIQFLTGRTVFWRGTFKLLCDVMSEPRQSGADPSAWQRNIISHRVNALLYGSQNGTKIYMNSQFLKKKKNNLTRYFQTFRSFKYLKPESL